MRLTCPYCGPRDSREFTYKGDATRIRPADDDKMFDYVYVRDNPKGLHQDYWLHQPFRHSGGAKGGQAMTGFRIGTPPTLDQSKVLRFRFDN